MLSLIKILISAQTVFAWSFASRDDVGDDSADSLVPCDVDESTPMFTLVAFHAGNEFQYNMVKYNGENLVLAPNEPAFFGHIGAYEGYPLSIPDISANPYDYDSSVATGIFYDETSVTVSANGLLVTIGDQSSSDFAVVNSVLTYQNSSAFTACPVWPPKSAAWGEQGLDNSKWARINNNVSVAESWIEFTMLYGINATTNATWLRHFEKFNLHAGSVCPDGVPGYEITLNAQMSMPLNYGPQLNEWEGDIYHYDDRNFSAGSHVFRRLLNLIACNQT